MFPLLHIIAFLAGIFCLTAVIKLGFVFRKTREENLGYLIKSLSFFSLGLFSMSLPAVLSRPFLIQVSWIVFWVLLYIDIYYKNVVAYSVSGISEKYRNILLSFMRIWLPAMTFLSLFVFSSSPVDVMTGQKYIFWIDGDPLWFISFKGGILAFLAMAAPIFYFRGGAKSENKRVRIRAFLIGAGMLTCTLPCLTFFVFHPVLLKFFSLESMLFFVITPLLIGIVIAVVGFFYRVPE